jgi:hypothetical protein
MSNGHALMDCPDWRTTDRLESSVINPFSQSHRPNLIPNLGLHQSEYGTVAD